MGYHDQPPHASFTFTPDHVLTQHHIIFTNTSNDTYFTTIDITRPDTIPPIIILETDDPAIISDNINITATIIGDESQPQSILVSLCFLKKNMESHLDTQPTEWLIFNMLYNEISHVFQAVIPVDEFLQQLPGPINYPLYVEYHLTACDEAGNSAQTNGYTLERLLQIPNIPIHGI